MIPLVSISPPIATVLAAVVAGFFGWIAVRGNKRIKQIELNAAQESARQQSASSERTSVLSQQQANVDQLQEDLDGIRKELAAVKKASSEETATLRADHAKEIASVRKDLAKANRRERAVEGYAWDLRRYIERGEGPPPPPWPSELGEE